MASSTLDAAILFELHQTDYKYILFHFLSLCVGYLQGNKQNLTWSKKTILHLHKAIARHRQESHK